MKIIPIPCLKDNYAYLLVCEKSAKTAVVDPSEAEPILDALKENRLTLSAIYNTHHHWDHTGGNEALIQAFPGLKVYGHHSDQGRILGQTEFLSHGDTFALGQTKGQILHNPGHTTGAISYWFAQEAALFTGDTLFSGGCGRTFEGDAKTMNESINGVIGQCPDHTQIYFGHEYTQNNLKFALTLEPNNPELTSRAEEVSKMRKENIPTTPVTLSVEKATNPFMRIDSEEILKVLSQAHGFENEDPNKIFEKIRSLKDAY